jgi:cell division protein FtsL
MQRTNRLNHAYSQAPWRVERQWVSIFLLIVVGFASIATLYLMVTSRAAIVGREIQDLRAAITDTEHANADLQTQLARLTSSNEMEKRAYGLGFRPEKPDEVEYLYVPGYHAPQGAMLAAAPELEPSAPGVPEEYTQSLLDWLDERLQAQGGGLQ